MFLPEQTFHRSRTCGTAPTAWAWLAGVADVIANRFYWFETPIEGITVKSYEVDMAPMGSFVTRSDSG